MWDADHARTIGKYELLRVASTGGTCSVWVAKQNDPPSFVAIKLLHERMQSKELRDRLIQEAQLCARVEHPNVVRIHEFGFTDWEAPYVVMELLDGCNLRDEIEERGSFVPRAAVRLLLPLLDGLAVAHDCNVVHRDLKPENVFLDHSTGEVVPKLVDFGIARCLEDSNERRITVSGSVFGTVRYLSPEQAVGRDDVDHRADIWGFCTLLYECIADNAPFGNEDTGEVLRSIIQTDVSTTHHLRCGRRRPLAHHRARPTQGPRRTLARCEEPAHGLAVVARHSPERRVRSRIRRRQALAQARAGGARRSTSVGTGA